MSFKSSGENSDFIVFASFPSISTFWIASRISTVLFSSLFWVILAFFWRFGRFFSICSRSAKISSVLIISLSLSGSTPHSTCTISESLKCLSTWTIASTSLICERNLFPSPSPLLAPLTSPAISTNSVCA